MSRAVTVEELRRVLEAMRQGFLPLTEPLRMVDADRAIAALPAEQKRSDSQQEPQGDSALERSDEHRSAVPELPKCRIGEAAVMFDDYERVVRYEHYLAMYKAGWALRERLGAALLGRSRAIARAEQAEQRAAAARREALLEVAAECERRDLQAMERGVKWSFYSDMAQWCRKRAEG